MRLEWKCSYETVLFDTVDGDLGENDYADIPAQHPTEGRVWYVRKHPKNNHNFVRTNVRADIQGKTKVNILDTSGAYYDEFIMPDNRILRQPSNRTVYRALGTRNYPQPVKEITEQEALQITSEDALWL
jgi:hypothetical protein